MTGAEQSSAADGVEPDRRRQGALRQADGSVLWRVWAPWSHSLSLITLDNEGRHETPMTDEGYGFCVARRENVAEGLRYAYRLEDGREYPDPASRWQPDGVHRPSAVLFAENYRWSDQSWHGIDRDDLVIYELHVGTFTPEGTFDAIIPRLPQLRELGITAIELMPVAQFAGERNWGYDGVHLSAAQNSYGGPHGLLRLVDAAHQAGMAVLLDVVYNHVGPEGNYLSKFGDYFTDRYRTPWGDAVNFDGPKSDPVRQLVVDNACMWVRDFHLDGLRLDAVHAIFDFSADHILAELQVAVQEEARRAGRKVHVIAESDLNDVRLVQPPDRGGYGLDGCWADDFHHAVHSVLTGERDGYYADFGRPEQLAKAYNRVFIYDGCYSPYRQRRHGNQVGDLERSRFVFCNQNHDQVGNRAEGDRMAARLSPEARRLAAGLLLVAPCTPLLFMGEEYAETRPFPFFCSFSDPELVEAVRRGRREEFAALAFEWGVEIPDPQDPGTFASAKLQWEWPEGGEQARVRLLYRDLLEARRRWPPLGDRQHTHAWLADSAVLMIERGTTGSLFACANLTAEPRPLPPLELGDRRWLLSTQDTRYGGSRHRDTPPQQLNPYEMLLFGKTEWLT
jgi:maltooligosyltrehalose trehalohydrolase